MKNIENIIEEISNIKSELMEKFDIEEIGVFGSYVRNEAKLNSDLDLLISLKPEHNIGLIKFNTLKELLSDLLNIRVDLVVKDGIKPSLKNQILKEVHYL